MLSTIAAAPNTRMMPPITDPAMYQEIRPVIQPKPRITTAIMAMIRSHVPVRRVCRAVRKFVREPNKAPPEPPPVVCAKASCEESSKKIEHNITNIIYCVMVLEVIVASPLRTQLFLIMNTYTFIFFRFGCKEKT